MADRKKRLSSKGNKMGFLKELLNVYWLRPETALWRALDCKLMEKYTVREPSLDMGTGDGVLSYIMAGGRFSRAFDAYRLVEKTEGFSKGKDIYDGVLSRKLKPVCDGNGLRYRYTIGIDHKENLLKKAMELPGFYGTTLQYDLDRPLPFKEGAFETIFSNILYWLTDLDIVLSGMHRAMRKKGRAYLFVPNDNFKELAWVYYKEDKPRDYDYLKYIDRGYGRLIKHCYDKVKWASIFKRNGFEIIEHMQYLSKPIIELWGIGTRPISHLLINMAARLNEGDRGNTKSEWIDFFSGLLAPLVKFGWESDARTEPAFHFFILEKS